MQRGGWRARPAGRRMTPTWPASGTGADAARNPLLRDLVELGGAGTVVVEVGGGRGMDERFNAGVVAVGVHRNGAPPTTDLAPFDILLSAHPSAPRPWVGFEPPRLDGALASLVGLIEAQPVAAAVAAQVLRTSLRQTFEEALASESIAYSLLLSAQGFAAWRAARPARTRSKDAGPRVVTTDGDGHLAIRLNRPARRNAFDAAMRDELVEAMAFASEHPDRPAVVLSGEGPAFSTGGDLDEFGAAADPGWAHLIRTLRSPSLLAHRLGSRLTAQVHGACVGAGIEVAAAATRVSAETGAFFRLPEVAMGLIPGAGGTVSIPRRIGRRRACYMALSGADIDLATALAWGLVDEIA
jgi:hypothetical protein